MEYCRVQIGCLIVVLYITFIYFYECKRYHKKWKMSLFETLLLMAIVCILLDGITACTVNYLDVVNETVNRVLHMLFLISIDTMIYLLFVYMLRATGELRKSRKKRLLARLPYIVSIVSIVWNIDSLEYRIGKSTNYSMGVSAYVCFISAFIYIAMTLIVFANRWHYVESGKRNNILTYMLAMLITLGVQAILPEILFTSVATTIAILGIYVNQEDPSKEAVTRYHEEMIIGFAALVESKDGSTGGHIKRTSAYVRLLAEELSQRGYYSEVLTKDYIEDLCLAAPMHDIGKMSVPDAVLQKPGGLTEEEFEVIKKHTIAGGKIIQDTFGHLENEQYAKMAYQVARYHHEKWNGKGYPEGLEKREIPLCARIMAVSDVFDAISQKRCYRDAIPLEQCFAIIKEGGGKELDPVIASLFLEIRDKVEVVYRELNDAGKRASVN